MDDYYTWKEKEDDKVYEQFIKEIESKGVSNEKTRQRNLG